MPARLLLLKALVRPHTRRGPGGTLVLVQGYSTRTPPAQDARQAELFTARPAPPPAPEPLPEPDPHLTGETCIYCGQPERVGIADAWTDHNFQLDTCCEAKRDEVAEEMAADPDYARALLARDGFEVRRAAFTGDGFGPVLLDYDPSIGDISRGEANAFIARWHRHNPPLPGDVFRAGVWNGADLIGVVMVGIPTAQAYMPAFQRRELIEVRRLCIRTDLPRELTWKAASTLYNHAAAEAERRGFRKIITYTLASEDGLSLRYARWKPEATIKGRSWNRPSRPRQDRAPTEDKVRWFKRLRPAAPS